jgi:glutaredoxin 3
MKNVAIYTTPTCTYCKKTKEFFKNNNVDFTEHDVTTDVAKRDEMIKRSGQMGVPVIDIDGTLVLGYDETKLKELLGL